MSLKGPFQPKPVYDAMKMQKILLRSREAGCSQPILACDGCSLQLCPQGQEPQQEGASRRHFARAVARAEPGSNLKFLPSSPGPGTGGSGSQVTCRNLPHFAVILFSKELLQLPLSTHGQGSSRIQSRPHTVGRMVCEQRGQCGDREDGVGTERMVWGWGGQYGDGEDGVGMGRGTGDPVYRHVGSSPLLLSDPPLPHMGYAQPLHHHNQQHPVTNHPPQPPPPISFLHVTAV